MSPGGAHVITPGAASAASGGAHDPDLRLRELDNAFEQADRAVARGSRSVADDAMRVLSQSIDVVRKTYSVALGAAPLRMLTPVQRGQVLALIEGAIGDPQFSELASFDKLRELEELRDAVRALPVHATAQES
jgi:hypothetical protein